MTIFSAVTVWCSTAALPDDLDGVGVEEAGGPAEQVDAVALQLGADDLDLAADDVWVRASRSCTVMSCLTR